MTARIVRIEVLALALAALTLAACSDDRKDLLAPQPPDKWVLTPIGLPILTPRFPSPGDFVDIAAGGNHTCARKFSGDVLCWGREGEAGYEKIVKTPTLALSGASQVAVGNAHACANYRQLGTWLVGSNGLALPDGTGWVPAPVLVI
jgi:hypothetical protein